MRNKKVFIFILILCIFSTKVSALNIKECEESEIHKLWASLSKEDKSKYIEPSYCKSTGIKDNNKYEERVRGSLPSYYKSSTSGVKNQYRLNACWAYSSSTILETYLKKNMNMTVQYSPKHMDYMESQSFSDIASNPLGKNREFNTGGNYALSSIYYVNQYGPILESAVPTDNTISTSPKINSSTIIGRKNHVDVNDIRLDSRTETSACTATEIATIKDLVYRYGAVGTNIYYDTDYLNSETHGYYYVSPTIKALSNHAVTIIGWDDSYSADNFIGGEHDGAWITQNSWGNTWGDNGLFYISYDDTNVCTSIMAITDVDTHLEDNVYAYANGEYTSYLQQINNAMNVFEKKTNNDEILAEVTFETIGATSYTVYYYEGNAAKDSALVSEMTQIATGSVSSAGYKTIRPDTNILIPASVDKYSIYVEFSDNQIPVVSSQMNQYDANHNIETIYSKEEFLEDVSYVQQNGYWYDLYTSLSVPYKAKISAYTDNAAIAIKNTTVEYSYNNSLDVSFVIDVLANTEVSNISLAKDNQCVSITHNLTNYNLTSGNSYSVVLTHNDLATIDNGVYDIEITLSNGEKITSPVIINKIPIDSIEITNEEDITIHIGEDLQMTATVGPVDHNITDPTISWSSSDDTIATINQTGLVVAQKPGEVVITATTTNGLTDTYTLTILSNVTSLEIGENDNPVLQGTEFNINYVCSLFDGSVDCTNYIKWDTTNSELATVSDGYVRTFKHGTVTITVSDIYDTISANMELVIVNPITSIALTNPPQEINKGNTHQIIANVLPVDTSDDTTVTWASSDPEIMTVEDGLLTAIKPGTVTITATTVNNKTASFEITVKSPMTDITLSEDNIRIIKGEERKIYVDFVPEDTTDPKILTWGSDDDYTATVDDGVIRGINGGSTTIRVYSSNEITKTINVTVIIPIKSISFEEESLDVEVGKTHTLMPIISPMDTNDDTTLTWVSDTPSVISVDSNGVITALKAGEATITVTTKNGKSAYIDIFAYIPITGLEFKEESVEINKEEDYTVEYTIEPANTTYDKTITWISSDPEIATVDSNGKITGVKPGHVTITGKTINNIEDTIEVDIVSNITAINVNPSEYTLNVEETKQLTYEILPSDTTQSKNITWTTDNSDVAIVSEDGVVTAIKPGTATIYAESDYEIFGSCEITVVAKLNDINLSYDNLEIEASKTVKINVEYVPENTTDSRALTWESEDESIATVDNTGVITGISAGSTRIIVKAVNNITKVINVHVFIPITGVSLEKDTYTISKDETLQLEPIITPENTTDDKKVYYENYDSSIISVSENGLVTGLGLGETTITLRTYNDKTFTVTIKVVVPITDINVDTTTIELNKGETKELIASVEPSNTTEDKTITYESSDDSVVTISNTGLITAVEVGNATITVRASNGLEKTINVKVYSPLESISFIEENVILNMKDTYTITTLFNPSNTTDSKHLTYTTDDSNIVTVSEDGVITPVGVGTTKVHAISDNNKTCELTVTVVIPIETVKLNKNTLTLKLDETATLTAEILPSNTTDAKTITWISLNPEVATVEDGVITPLAYGKTTIQAVSVNGVIGSCEVLVSNPITDFDLNVETVFINVGATYNVVAEILPIDTTDNKEIIWESGNTNIVTVENGVIVSHNPGTTNVTATLHNGLSKTIKVIVSAPLTGIKLNKTSLSLELNKSYKLGVNFLPSNTTDSKALTFTSSNTKVATITNQGVITAKTLGTSIITVRDSKGHIARLNLTVTKIHASNFTVSAISIKTYNGRAQKPSITVKYNGKTLKLKTDYVKSYSNTKYPGKAAIILNVPGKNKLYMGSKTVNFIIKPKKISIKTPTSKNKTITVKWTKHVKVDNYEMQYRLNNGTWKTIKVKGSSYVINNLTKGKSYQVRVRGIITVDNKTYAGAWSTTKTIKCK